MALVYAQLSDLVDGDVQWLPAPPANAGRLLRTASRMVRRATMTAFYATDTVGMPTDAAVLDAFKDATCAQVAAWVTTGVDPATGGLLAAGEQVLSSTSKSLDGGSVSKSYDNSLSATIPALQARQALATDLCDEAVAILTAARLLPGRVCAW